MNKWEKKKRIMKENPIEYYEAFQALESLHGKL